MRPPESPADSGPSPEQAVSRVLIVAWDRTCLIPVFGEAALFRLVRLAASENRAVTVWLAPDLLTVLAGRPRQAQTLVSWQVLDFAELPKAGPTLAADPDETLLVLSGNSVWDRLTFRAALGAAGRHGPFSPCRLKAREVTAAVAGWRETGGNLPALGSTLPVFLHRPEDSRLAESLLVSALAAATQGSDGMLARWVDRPLSRRLSPVLAARRTSPHAVTLAGTTVGCLGALLLAQGGYWPHLLGALLFLAAVVLDGVDGEVARLTVRETRFGHYLDIITDNLVHLAVFCGIAWGLSRQAADVRHLYALALLLPGFGLSALAAYLVLTRIELPPECWPSWTRRLVAALNSRDFAYVVVLLAMMDRLAWFLWGAAVGSNVFAGCLFLLYRQCRRPPPQGGLSIRRPT
jgi:phosphatidylglycerophosphate synthase